MRYKDVIIQRNCLNLYKEIRCILIFIGLSMNINIGKVFKLKNIKLRNFILRKYFNINAKEYIVDRLIWKINNLYCLKNED